MENKQTKLSTMIYTVIHFDGIVVLVTVLQCFLMKLWYGVVHIL